MNNSTISFIDGDLKKKSIYIITQVEKNNELMVITPKIDSDEFLVLLRQKKININMDVKPKLDLLKKVRIMVLNQTKIMLSRRIEISWYRILVSFIISFIVFLFLNFIVIDPIPILDELGISILVGFLTYFFLYKFNFLYFIPKKKMEEYSVFIDSIEVYDSKKLGYLNIIFEKYYNKLTETMKQDEKLFYKNEKITNIKKQINNELNELDINGLIEIKDMIHIISKNYSFNAIKNYRKYKKEEKKSNLSRERFLFFYILYNILL